MSPDEPNFAGWCDELRARAGGLYPSEVRMVPSHAELHVNLAPACALVVESFPVGTQELGCAPQLKVVHKYGAVLRNIGTAACAAAGVKVLSVMKNPDALMTSCSRSTM
jgi:phosphoglycerate dehydrogenase-like enzyme